MIIIHQHCILSPSNIDEYDTIWIQLYYNTGVIFNYTNNLFSSGTKFCLHTQKIAKCLPNLTRLVAWLVALVIMGLENLIQVFRDLSPCPNQHPHKFKSNSSRNCFKNPVGWSRSYWQHCHAEQKMNLLQTISQINSMTLQKVPTTHLTSMGACIPSARWPEGAVCRERKIWSGTCACLRPTFLKYPGNRGEWYWWAEFGGSVYWRFDADYRESVCVTITYHNMADTCIWLPGASLHCLRHCGHPWCQ